MRQSAGLTSEPVTDSRALSGRLRRLRAGETLPIEPRSGPQIERVLGCFQGAPFLDHHAVVRDGPHGPCFSLDRRYPLAHLHGDRALSGALERDLGAALLGVDDALEGFDVRRALFFDLETTGLGSGMGTLPFQIGAGWFEADAFVLRQWLLREPDEEAAALTELNERISAARWLVTYNGRTYDVPLLRARLRLHRMDDPSAELAGHLDLLHPSRALLRHGLPNCKLSTVETYRLGLQRVGDIPGAEVPQRYLDYLAGGEPAPLKPVVAHNRDDILSMVTLLDLLTGVVEDAAVGSSDPMAALSVAKRAERLKRWDTAEAIYRRLVETGATRDEARKGAARITRRRAR